MLLTCDARHFIVGEPPHLKIHKEDHRGQLRYHLTPRCSVASTSGARTAGTNTNTAVAAAAAAGQGLVGRDDGELPW